MSTPLSVVVTILNNAKTHVRCLVSAAWADKIVVLDLFSTDETCEVAPAFGRD